MIFILLQSDDGDLYTVNFTQAGTQVTGISVQYYDTVFPSVSMCILKNGHIFCAGEFCDHKLFKILNLGTAEKAPIAQLSTDK